MPMVKRKFTKEQLVDIIAKAEALRKSEENKRDLLESNLEVKSLNS